MRRGQVFVSAHGWLVQASAEGRVTRQVLKTGLHFLPGGGKCEQRWHLVYLLALAGLGPGSTSLEPADDGGRAGEVTQEARRIPEVL